MDWEETFTIPASGETAYEYRVVLNWEAVTNYLSEEFPELSGYNAGKKLGSHNQVVTEKYYDVKGADINVKNPGTTPVKIILDETALTNKSKVYDGTGIDTSELEKAIKIQTADGTDVTAAMDVSISFYWEDSDYVPYESALPANEAVHAGSYTLQVSAQTNDTYLGTTELYNGNGASGKTVMYFITKRTLEAEPKFKDPIYSGTYVDYDGYSVVADWNFAENGGPVAGDEDVYVDINRWYIYESNSIVMLNVNAVPLISAYIFFVFTE